MAEAFIGLGVRVELNNSSSLEGIVSHIDSHTHLLTLKNVKLDNKESGRTQQLAIYGVSGTDIKDIQILSNQQNTFQQQRPAQPSQNNVKNTGDAKPFSKSNTPDLNNNEITQSQMLTTALLPRSPFTDPAIIYQLHYQQIVQDSRNPSKTIRTASTGDSDSKYEEELHSNAGEYERNSKNSSNGNNHNGDYSSEVESDSAVFGKNKSSRRKKSHNTNGYYHNNRMPQSPGTKICNFTNTT
ncbi:1062_t:CDS:2, partial [Acaulospora colombiana]